jgi:hypothetical protein
MVKRDTLVRCFDMGMAVPGATAPQQEESFFASGDHQPPMCPGGGPRRDADAVSNATAHGAWEMQSSSQSTRSTSTLRWRLTLGAVHSVCGPQFMEWNTSTNTCSSRTSVFMPL